MCAGKEFQLVEGADTEKAREEKLLVISAGLGDLYWRHASIWVEDSEK